MKIQNYIKKDNNLVPKYELIKSEFSKEEEKLLDELRNNLVELAISSGDNFQINELALLNDIKNFLKIKLPLLNDLDLDDNNYSDPKFISDSNLSNISKNQLNMSIEKNHNLSYLEKLTNKFYQEILGYGEIDPLIKDDELEEIISVTVYFNATFNILIY